MLCSNTCKPKLHYSCIRGHAVQRHRPFLSGLMIRLHYGGKRAVNREITCHLLCGAPKNTLQTLSSPRKKSIRRRSSTRASRNHTVFYQHHLRVCNPVAALGDGRPYLRKSNTRAHSVMCGWRCSGMRFLRCCTALLGPCLCCEWVEE